MPTENIELPRISSEEDKNKYSDIPIPPGVKGITVETLDNIVMKLRSEKGMTKAVMFTIFIIAKIAMKFRVIEKVQSIKVKKALSQKKVFILL